LFNKAYFETLHEKVLEYLQTFAMDGVTVTIKVAPDHEFHLYRVITSDDTTLTFAFYEKTKQKEIRRTKQDLSSYAMGFPVITLPYVEIRWVEFNPGKTSGAKGAAGFRYDVPS
jgi:hypothetical protein